MRFPSDRQVIAVSGGKAGVIEKDPGRRALFIQLEARHGEDSRIPTNLSPSLDDALAGQELELASDDVSAKKAEGPTGLPTDLRGLGLEVCHRYGPADQLDLLKLLGVGKRVVDALGTGLDDRLLVDSFGVVRNAVIVCGPGIVGREGENANCGRDARHPQASSRK